jgi:hypothetical protein
MGTVGQWLNPIISSGEFLFSIVVLALVWYGVGLIYMGYITSKGYR